jgi:hypothetical protein
MYHVWSNPLKDVDSRVFTRMLWKEGRMVALLYPSQLCWRGDNKINQSINSFHVQVILPYILLFLPSILHLLLLPFLSFYFSLIYVVTLLSLPKI